MGENVSSAVHNRLPLDLGRRDRRATGSGSVAPGHSVVVATPLLTLFEGAAILLASFASGIAYHEFVHGTLGSISIFLGVGALAAVLYCTSMGAVDRNKRMRRANGYEAFRDVVVVWTCVVLFVTFLAFALKFDAHLSRGTMLTFFAATYVGLIAVRAQTARIAKWNTLSRYVRPERLILVGAQQLDAINELADEVALSGFRRPVILLLNANCSDDDWRGNVELY